MILVTGAARSGTSLITSMLQACGGYLGEPEHINELYEHKTIRDGFLKPLLRAYGGDARGQRVFPDMSNVDPKPTTVDGIEAIITKHFGNRLYTDAIYKDAKLLLVWELFERELAMVDWVIVRRPREDIIDSCMRTHFMNARTTREEWGEWVDYHEARIESLKKRTRYHCEVWTNEVKETPSKLRPICNELGLTYDDQKVRALIDPKRLIKNGNENV